MAIHHKIHPQVNTARLHPARLIVPLAILLVTGAPGEDKTPEPRDADNGSEMRKYQPDPGAQLPPLAKQLFQLQRASFDTPEARGVAIRQWFAANGAALKAESDARREAERPARESMEREARLRLQEALDEQVALGRLGALEAEFMRLTRAPFNSATERHEAVRKWNARNGAALKAERDGRRAREAPETAALRAEAAETSRLRIADALEKGLVGPRQAELMSLHARADLTPAEKGAAIRNWMATHGNALRSEQAARRGSAPPGPPGPPGQQAKDSP